MNKERAEVLMRLAATCRRVATRAEEAAEALRIDDEIGSREPIEAASNVLQHAFTLLATVQRSS